MTAHAIESLLAGAEIGVLATASASGRPDATPVWFDFDGRCVRILVHRDSTKARNIRENPRVCLTVDTRRPPYRGVQLRGRATLGGPDPVLRRRLAERYLGRETGARYVESSLDLDREDALVTIAIEGKSSWDYSQGD
jgi:PPOX class probable F420-dependent enzyme